MAPSLITRAVSRFACLSGKQQEATCLELRARIRYRHRYARPRLASLVGGAVRAAPSCHAALRCAVRARDASPTRDAPNVKLAHVPVIALTSFTEEENQEKAIAAGFDGYAMKTNKENILRAVETFLVEE